MTILALRPVAFSLVLGAALALASCAEPPREAFTKVSHAQEPAAALSIGANTAHEACTLQRGTPSSRIYCGDYLQAAGHVVTPAQATDPTAFVTDSAWRTAVDQRFQCGAPAVTTVLDNPAVMLACTRRQGGWPHVVIATRIGGMLYV